MNLDQDALDAYEGAKERTRLLDEEWQRLGRPLLAKGSKGQDIAHPLLPAWRAAVRLEDDLRRPLLKKHRGPETSAVVRPLALAGTKRITRRGEKTAR